MDSPERDTHPRSSNDCGCGTGGMLTITKDRIQQINPQAKVFLYGQDSRSEAQTDEVKTARRQRRFGLAQRARRVRRRGKPPKQLHPQTWAIACSDMLILEPEGKDAENIKHGSTLSSDPLSDKHFDFQFVKPPYGYEWSKDFDDVTKGNANFALVQRFIHHLTPAEKQQPT